MTAARNSRHVLNSRMRVRAGAPKHALIFNVEESLRLCSLPDENEGRVYYFRRLHVAGLPEHGDRRRWQDAFQRAMLELARQAVYATHTAALMADAVYFTNEQEACEWLLRSMLRQNAQEFGRRAWFRDAISGSPAAADEAAQIVRVIEKLRGSAASWVAVAAAVFQIEDPAPLLARIPENAARAWLRELGGDEPTPHAWLPTLPQAGPPASPPLLVLPRLTTLIAQAAHVLGPEDPRVVFLATLAVLLARPSEMESGTATRSGRLLLRTLTVPKPASPAALTHPARSGESTEQATIPAAPTTTSAQKLAQNRDEISVEGFAGMPEQEGATVEPSRKSSLGPGSEEIPTVTRARISAQTNAKPRDEVSLEKTARPSEQDVAPADPAPQLRSRSRSEAILPQPRAGEKTQAGGLYFLLNALRVLNVVEAKLGIPFLADLFRFLANHASIQQDDTILRWTKLALEESVPIEPDRRALRIWAWKLRRWCWKNAHISLREIVRRPGIVTVNRTDLDVSLSIDSADLRIRRVGLDLDPGWLPWFGRVVRFHYTYRGELP